MVKFIKSLFRRRGYAKIINVWSSTTDYLINYGNLEVYDREGNIFHSFKKYELLQLYIKAKMQYDSDLHNKKISESKYDSYCSTIPFESVCNCKIGDGRPDIQTAKKYNIIDTFNEAQDTYFIEQNSSTFIYKNSVNYYHLYKNDCLDYVKPLCWSSLKNKYYQRACLKCNTCLDDKSRLMEDVYAVIKKLQDELDIKQRISDICGGDKIENNC